MSALLSALLLSAATAAAAAAAGAPLAANNFASVPDSAEAALAMDGAAGAALLTVFAPQLGHEPGPLAPGPLGHDLRQMVGVDLLSPAAVAEAGVSSTGTRALVLGDQAVGLSAPVEDEAKARKCVAAFLEQLGPTRQTRGAPLKAPLASGGGAQERAGWVVKTGAGLRLITASGKGSVTLAIQLGHVGRANEHPLTHDPQIAAAQEQLQGPLLAWVRGRGAGPVKGAVVRLAWSAKALDAQGLLLPAPAKKDAPALSQLVDGESPPVSACGPALFCARAAPGPLLREWLERGRGEALGRALRTRAQREPIDQTLRALLASATGGALLRIDSFDPRLVAQGTARDLDSLEVLAASGAATTTPLAGANEAGEVTLPGPPAACAGLATRDAKGLAWLSWPCRPPGPEVVTTGGPRELWVRLDTPALWKALAPISALDALKGQAVGTVVALKLLWGGLLAASGPIEVAVRPPAAEGLPAALAGSLALDVQWPLPGKAPAQ
jgi:hypothetical protein